MLNSRGTGSSAGATTSGSGRRSRPAVRNSQWRPLQYWQAATAATVSHVAAHSLTAPLTVVQITSQAGLPAAARGAATTGAGVVRLSWRWARSQGPRALWKGNLASCARVLPFNKAQALVYANAQWAWGDASSGKLTPGRAFGSGVAAAALATLAVHPLEVVQTRLVVQDLRRRTYKGIRDCLRTVARTEGVTALYRGITPAVLAWVPFTAAGFLSHEVSGYMASVLPRDALSHAQLVALAFLTSCASLTLSQFVAYPLDTVKRVMQAQVRLASTAAARGLAAGPGGSQSVSTMRGTFRSIVQEHGVTSLWRGASAMVMRVLPFAGVMSLSYAACEVAFQAGNEAWGGKEGRDTGF